MFNYMRSLNENLSLTIPILIRKLATLLAISTLLRVSELASLDRTTVLFTSSGANLSLSRPRKSQTSGSLRCVVLQKVPDKKICPIDCLWAYLIFTDFMRTPENHNQVFISLVQPFGSVSGNTVGRWVKDFLASAGIDTEIFTAYSARGAAASRRATLGADLHTILKAGDWTNEATFCKYYNRRVDDSLEPAA